MAGGKRTRNRPSRISKPLSGRHAPRCPTRLPPTWGWSPRSAAAFYFSDPAYCREIHAAQSGSTQIQVICMLLADKSTLRETNVRAFLQKT